MAITRTTPTTAVLTNLYDIIREIIKDTEAYYTAEEIEALKENKENVFLESE